MGRLVKRLRRGGTVLESSNPMYPPMAVRPENNPVIEGVVIGVSGSSAASYKCLRNR